MKLKIKELNANPFKKEINEGKFNEEIIEKIRSNLKELGLMGSLPVFKKDDKYYLVAGHHRAEALKREFGKEYEVNVTLHNYSEENVLRGMVVENLTQRSDELMEVADNLACVRGYLREMGVISGDEKTPSSRGRIGEGRPTTIGIKEIYDWLNKNGEVMSIGKISEFLKVYDNLDRRLLKKAFKVEGGEGGKEEGKISIEDAKTLARIDKKEQFAMQEILKETGLDHKEKSKLVTEYINAPEDIKKKVIEKEIDIKNITEEVIEKQIKQSNQEGHTEFIPNFETRLKDFGYNVAKLEQQVAIFRKVFGSNTFNSKYRSLGAKEKKFLDNSIYDIRKRIKKCYDEVEFFISKIEDKKLLEAQK